LQQLITK
jgi:hypothetical protein